MEMTVHHQNFMLSVRLQMGWPPFAPANDCLCFCSGQPLDFAVGSEIARIAQAIGKDAIYTGWASLKATEPTSFVIAYRELLTMDVIDGLMPYAADDTAPVILVNERGGEAFAIDRRGSLARLPYKPVGIAKGRRRAMKRIKATAAAMANVLLENNQHVPPGADWVRPDQPMETIVRFN